MLNREEDRYSDDDERRPLLTNRELYDECLRAAATIVVAFTLGIEFEDCRVTDDGVGWPVPVAYVEFKYPDGWRWEREALQAVAAIHEAGAMAVAKMHGRGPLGINRYTEEHRTSTLLDDPVIWKTIKDVARLIENTYEGDGCYGTLGTDFAEDNGGEDLAAFKLIRASGLTLGCEWRRRQRPDPEAL